MSDALKILQKNAGVHRTDLLDRTRLEVSQSITSYPQNAGLICWVKLSMNLVRLSMFVKT